MMCPIVPQGMIGEQWGLLTALGLGFFFGFSLERAGFANARKLAAQFYLYDMTVFKVMFTAIIVAMTGLVAFDALGWVDLSLVWINPTFLWPQLVGGFLLGVGFIVSGLCPGTSVVAAASGRIDGLLAFGGAFVGTFVFSLLMDWFPGLTEFYSAGAQGRSLLPPLLGVPAPWLALAVIAVALGGFLGAEKVERIFRDRHAPIDLTPSGGGKAKFAIAGGLAVVAIVAGLAPQATPLSPLAPAAAPVEPLRLAEAIIAGEPGLVVLDLRVANAAEIVIPGAVAAGLADTAPPILASAAAGSAVFLLAEGSDAPALPESWPAGLDYRYLRGGAAAWRAEVLTPREPRSADLDEMAAAKRHNEMAAWFSGVEAKPVIDAPPPAAPSGGAKKKKADGGC